MDDPIWISLDLARAIHRRQLAEHGGADGVRDQGLLDASLNRPRQLFAYADPTPDIPALGAAYAVGLTRNHPFIDGNKRTAAVLCETFLELNGVELTASDAALYPVFLALAAGQLDEAAFTDWLREHTAPTDG